VWQFIAMIVAVYGLSQGFGGEWEIMIITSVMQS
jgi:hypothetical protein